MGDLKVMQGLAWVDVTECLVRFKCKKCGGEEILNAYKGEPRHEGGCGGAVMVPISLVRRESPYADIGDKGVRKQ